MPQQQQVINKEAGQHQIGQNVTVPAGTVMLTNLNEHQRAQYSLTPSLGDQNGILDPSGGIELALTQSTTITNVTPSSMCPSNIRVEWGED